MIDDKWHQTRSLCPVHNGRREVVNSNPLFIFSCTMKDDIVILNFLYMDGHRANFEISHCGSSVCDDQVCVLSTLACPVVQCDIVYSLNTQITSIKMSKQ